jgi:riboflavin-specific deaminase-like protein
MNKPLKVTISYAQSIDGRIATATGDSRYISCAEALDLQQELRRDNDAVAVGIGTVLIDNPRLTCKIKGARNPMRVVFDSRLSLPLSSLLAATAHEIPTVCLAIAPRDGEEESFALKRTSFSALGVSVITAASGPDGRVDIASALEALDTCGIGSLFVEGGSSLITAFLAARMIDTLLVDIAPIILGEGKQAIGDLGIRFIADALVPKSQGITMRGKDAIWRMDF